MKTEQQELLQKAVKCYAKQDGQAALFILRRLIAEGYTRALSLLGTLYETGCGSIEQNIDVAIEWYLKSIEELDDSRSHLAAARIYMANPRLDPDKELTLYHLNLLAENDVMGGHYGLGVLYQHGIGLEKDQIIAKQCFERAAKLGHLGARIGLLQLEDKPKPFQVMLAVLRFKLAGALDPSDPRLAIS